MTVYRMTPFGVLDLGEKDSGDAKGDTSFVLSRKTISYMCRVNPSDFMCTSVTQFSGDNPNSTDLILAFTIEVDGNWGPYLKCNPVDIKTPTGLWNCSNDIPSPKPAGWSSKCTADKWDGYDSHCYNDYIPHATKTGLSLGDCCDQATHDRAAGWTYHRSNQTCSLYAYTDYHPRDCGTDSVSGYPHHSDTTACECPRVHKAVGLEDLELAYHGQTSMHPAGGLWYSHPKLGQCAKGEVLGTNGCTWRVIELSRAINATCMYKQIDRVVEKANEACFNACPQPTNETSTCYLKCYSDSTNSLSHDQLEAPWDAAFATTDESKGGCPQVHLP